MKTRERGIFSWFTGSGIADDTSFQEDRRCIEELYRDNGYIRVKVDLPKVTTSRNGNSITVSFLINEGTVYNVRSMHIKGDVIFDERGLSRRLATRSGQTYRSSLVSKDVSVLTEIYQEEGYAFVDVTPQLLLMIKGMK